VHLTCVSIRIGQYMATTKTPPGEITRLLQAFRTGDPQAEDALMTVVYGELRSLAAHYMRLERENHTLQPTALVHEVYLRLIAQRATDWADRTHFFAVAAKAMRRIVVDYARRSKAQKRPAAKGRVTLTPNLIYSETKTFEILAIHQSLERLSKLHPLQAKAVELTFFGGLTAREIAMLLGLGERTVEKYLRVAKAWLQAELDGMHGDTARLATRHGSV
jgi:RNA polymerase sigma-70 factor (ECF subfamily)